MTKIVGIGEYAVSSSADDIIRTYALGSCVAVVVYSPLRKLLGMVHIALPDSSIDKDNKSIFLPGYFADIAIPMIFNRVFGGYPSMNTIYKVSLYGGAYSKNSEDIFNVGIRNIRKIKDILIVNNIRFDSLNTGGFYSRTIEAYASNGNIIISKQPMTI